MKKLLLPCIFLASAAFIPVPQQTKVQREDHPAFSRSHNQFAFRFMKAALEVDTTNGNKLVSPLSLYLMLSILYNGAGHATRDSIGEMLQATDIGALNLGGMCKQLLLQLPGEDENVQLALANAIWCNKRKTLLQPSFSTLTENLYYTPIQSMDFSGHAAAGKINSWADNNSFHRIPTLIQQTSPRDLMYLANVLYFKSDWKIPFDLDRSHISSFHRVNGDVTQIPFMSNDCVLKTFSDTGFTMVELPYGRGKSYSMYVILPENERRSVNDFAADFSPEKLDYALSHMTDQYIDFSLPRWQYDYSMDHCEQALGHLGMGIAFSSREADFSNMYKAQARNIGGGYISKVLHKTSITVNEKGTEVAAVTLGDITFGTKVPPKRSITADHPFMYMIVEKQQDLILFTGIVNDPAPGSLPKQGADRHR